MGDGKGGRVANSPAHNYQFQFLMIYASLENLCPGKWQRFCDFA